MATYIIVSRFSPEAFRDPKDFKKLAADVSGKIKSECPGVKWKDSYATLRRFDVVDVVEGVMRSKSRRRRWSSAPTDIRRPRYWLRGPGENSWRCCSAGLDCRNDASYGLLVDSWPDLREDASS